MLMIDVRERSEFQIEHAPGAINIPLSEFKWIESYRPLLEGHSVTVMCRSGVRAKSAQSMLDGIHVHASVYPGGLLEWKSSGKPTVLNQKISLSLFRQVQIVVGALIILFSIAALIARPELNLATSAIGVGLLGAGLTGNCLLGSILAKMPWNQYRT